jgi:hypothetical protein
MGNTLGDSHFGISDRAEYRTKQEHSHHPNV